jgi:hypothetical protein
MKTMPTHSPPEDSHAASLRRLGFSFAEPSGNWRRDDFIFWPDGAWPRLEFLAASTKANSLADDLGRPGLWRSVGEKGSRARVFELPASALDAGSETDEFFPEESGTVFEQTLRWAMETASGEAPTAWEAPPTEAIETRIPRDRRAVCVGGSICAIEVVRGQPTLALEAPILNAPAGGEVDPRREAMLAALLSDAMNQWFFVRLGARATGETRSVVAEVNFTGASDAVLDACMLSGLEALRLAVCQLLEPASLLAKPRVSLRSLEIWANDLNQQTKGSR